MPAASDIANAIKHAFQAGIFMTLSASTSHKIGDSASIKSNSPDLLRQRKENNSTPHFSMTGKKIPALVKIFCQRPKKSYTVIKIV
jgi:hypothetical protein